MAEKVIVYEAAISSLFTANGDVGRHVRKVNRQTAALARVYAPKRTRELSISHHTYGPFKRGPYRVRGFVGNSAEHALWVHDGTKTPIRSRRGRLMPIPVSTSAPAVLSQPGSQNRGVVWRRRVRGQRANPWLDRAQRTVAARYR